MLYNNCAAMGKPQAMILDESESNGQDDRTAKPTQTPHGGESSGNETHTGDISSTNMCL